MTTNQSMKENEKFLDMKRWLETGAMSFVEAVRWFVDSYYDNVFTREETEEAVRLLAKVTRRGEPRIRMNRKA